MENSNSCDDSDYSAFLTHRSYFLVFSVVLPVVFALQFGKVLRHLEEDQVGAMRLADEEVQLPVATVNQETVAAEGKVQPRRGNLLADRTDDLGVGQSQRMVAHGVPGGVLRQTGELARTVVGSQVDQSHGTRHDSGCQ